MNRSRARALPALLALLVVLAMLVAGCESKSTADKQAYIKKNNAIQQDAANAFTDLDVANPTSVKQAKSALDAATDKLAALDPPSDYAKPHAEMVAALRELSAVLTAAQQAVASKNAKQLAATTTRMQAAKAKLSEAIDTMNADRK
jgi:hypothetical protein